MEPLKLPPLKIDLTTFCDRMRQYVTDEVNLGIFPLSAIFEHASVCDHCGKALKAFKNDARRKALSNLSLFSRLIDL